MAKKDKKNTGSGVIISIVIIAVIVLIILGISLFSKKNTQDETNNQEVLQNNTETPKLIEHIVEITLEGFVPRTLEIKQGEKVTWINRLATEGQPASDSHPTHTNYPGSSVIMCNTAEEKNTFDACRGLKKGESYSFVFNKVGSWGYHNHLQPSKDGRIIVS